MSNLYVQGTGVKRSLVLLVVLSMLAACGGADEPGTTSEPTPDPVDTTEPPASEPGSESASEAMSEPASEMPEPDVTVTAVDYAYEGIPEPITAGSVIGLENQGDEPHELVAFRIPEDETRTLEELLALPEDEEPPVDFVGVVIAPTTGEAVYPEGPVTLDEPGRYAFVCFLPVGVTDEDFEAMMAAGPEGSPPPLPEGPPHFTEGMWAEVAVE